MAKTKPFEKRPVRFSSTVFPDAEDMALWNSLTPDEQRAAVAEDEEAGYRSGVASDETLEVRLSRVRAERRGEV